MFYRSLALAATLLGSASACHEGCYPAYDSTKTYEKGDIVSATGQITTTHNCDSDEAGCVNGKKTTTKTATLNYVCDENTLQCNGMGIVPGDPTFGFMAWKEECPDVACVGTAVIAAATMPLPDLGGCPAEFSESDDYGGGDRVSVCEAGTEWCDVYQCKPSLPAWGKYCQEPGFEPGSSLYWQQAWDKFEGSCFGTIAPTPVVTIDGMEAVGGCPLAYESGTTYTAGDRVSKDNFVYECKPWPYDGWCGLIGYEPMEDFATPGAWKEAWNVIGYCSGTIAPSSAPNFVSLKNLGGCPAEWEQGTNGFGYDEGDRVSRDGLVFQCKSWPFSAHCGQAGYEPLESPAAPDAWKSAWSVVGYCEGTLSPSSIAGLSLENLKNLGSCPKRKYATGDEYGSGEQVKVCESAGAECCAVYQCATDNPNPSGWCGQVAYEPGEGWAWTNAWSLEGYCCGNESTGPTQSPSFDALDVAEGCPAEYSRTATYEVGDEISYVVSKSPERKIVYECKVAGYCNQDGFAPGIATEQRFVTIAWTLKGACEGTLAPTDAPTPYVNEESEEGAEDWPCRYERCRTEDADVPCTWYATGADPSCLKTTCNPETCTVESEVCTDCTETVPTETCVDAPVENWAPSTSPNWNYANGDFVRVGLQRYECTAFDSLYCSLIGPEDPTYGTTYWTERGVCPSTASGA